MVEQANAKNKNEASQDSKKHTREIAAIIVAILVLIASVAQWLVFRQQLQIGNAAAISFANVTLDNFGGKTTEGDPYWLFTPHIENSGNTSTQHLTLKYGSELNVGSPQDADAWKRIWKGKSFTTQYNSIGPHITIPGLSVQTNGWFLNQMVAGKASAYFVGEATYNDIFGQKHVTRFCIQAIVPIRDYADTTIRPVLISMPQCTDHNCIDDECHDGDQ